MAKRYHQSKKARKKEHMGMEMYERGPVKNREYYAGEESRRYQEMRDAGMINEDYRAVANMPQNVEYKPYPTSPGYLPEDLDDTLTGIDRQMAYDNNQKMKNFHPKKV